MEPINVGGIWWLPDEPDQKLPGNLTMSDDGLELNLIGSFRDMLAGGIRGVETDGSVVHTFTEESLAESGIYPRILGQSDQGIYTLEDCYSGRRSGLFTPVSTEQVLINQVFKGVHFELNESLQFSQLTVGLRGLAQWVQRTGLSREIVTEDRDGVGSRLVRASINLKPLEKLTFSGPDGADCGLACIFRVGNAEFDRMHISETHNLDIKFNELRDLQQLLRLASHVQDLVSIATDRRAAFEGVSLRHPDVAVEHDGVSRLLPVEMYSNWSVRPRTTNPVKPKSVIFTLDDFGGVDGISRWLDVAQQHAVALSRMMIARYSDSVYAADALMNSAAAIEGYDRRKHNDGDSTSFVNRVKRSVEYASDPFPDLVVDTETFAKLLKKHRVEVAHHLGSIDTASTAQIFLGRAASWLLIFCLLRDCDAPDEVFKSIQGQQGWRSLKRHLAAVLLGSS